MLLPPVTVKVLILPNAESKPSLEVLIYHLKPLFRSSVT